MTGLHIHISNRMEILARELAGITRMPLNSPLTPEIIIVQSRGMERWVSMALAEQNGICANIRYPFPNAFLEEIFKQMMPDLPEMSVFDPEIMTFRLMHLIPRLMTAPGFEPLNSYLADDDTRLKLFQLSRKIADLFDQYLVFRPQMIFQWEEKKENKMPSEVWQAKLWRELARGHEKGHRARLREIMLERVRRLEFDPSKLAERISIFGISYLPPFHLQVFTALSGLIETHFFLVDPCREYWADIVSEREIKKMRRISPRVSENIEWYHFEKGNRLLAAMGTLGRDFYEMIAGLDCQIHEHFEEPRGGNILAGIQSDVLNLRDREKSPFDGLQHFLSEDLPAGEMPLRPLPVSEGDLSIQVHSCHSPMREIEVLHDNLLAMFEKDPDLLPKDIIVMAPDIEIYAPYVQAVFAAPAEENLRIPFSIADQSPLRESRIFESFLALLDLPGSRFGALQVFGLLEFPGLRERFGLGESDLKTIERWIRDTQIRWGIDKDSRLSAGLPGYSENTWRAGLERLLLGYALPGQNRVMFNGILPYDNIEGEDARVLGRFLEFAERLFSWAKSLVVPKKLGEWQQELLTALEHFFKPDESTERDLQFLRRLLGGLTDRETVSCFNDNIGPEVIRCYLKSVLTQNNYGAGFLKGGVTFCAMLPMRSIPFKIICLIGMNNDVFPRDHQPLNFDLMAKYPQTGDRSRRKDDKYLFLESIVSARRGLYVSYVGQSIQDNSRIPPSVLVSELLDTIEKSFECPGINILDQIVTTHRLQPFSSGYFQEGSGLFSYSIENMRACASGAEKSEHRPFISRKLPLSPQEQQEWQDLDLESLCLFFSHPAKFFIQRRLGIILEDEAVLVDERENFDLDPLQRFLVEQNLIKSSLTGVGPEDFKPVQRALGQLPHGRVGDYRYNETSIDIEKFVAKTSGVTSGAPRHPIEVDLDIADLHLSGRLAPLTEAGYVQIRYARQRAKDLLNCWIYHLLYCHLAPSECRPCSYLICKDTTVQFGPVADSRRIIEDLLTMFRHGLEQPIHFFPNSSYEYAVHLLRKSASEQAAINKAGQRWNGSEFAKNSRGESEDPYYDLCFRRSDPLDESFKKSAVGVFSPLLACSREIML